MKAFVLTRFSSPENSFELKEWPDPRPGATEILVEAEAFGLNYADVAARNGTYRDAPPKPCVLGYEALGRVIEVGGEVTHLKPGDRVTALTRFGGYGKRFVAQAMAAVKIDENMDPGIALALTVQYGTAWYMAMDAIHLHPGDHVLIQAAAGGVGIALVQMALHQGCIVFGTAGSDEKVEFLRSLGVQHPINYRKVDFYEEVQRIRKGQGVEVVFDSLGVGSFRKGRKLLNAGGKILGFGSADRSGAGRHVFSSLKTLFGFGFPSAAFMLLHSRSIIGVNMLRIADESPALLKRSLDGVMKAYGEGWLRPHVHKVFTAEQLPEAHRELESRRSVGKIIVKW